MIDTITIKVPLRHLLPGRTKQEHYRYLETWDKRSKGSFVVWKRNPTQEEKESGEYYPQLTAHREKELNWLVAVKIQFSAPKLLYGNNLDEVASDDLIVVTRRLKARLEDMGLEPKIRPLINAKVVSVHYSKNIILSTHTASAVVNQLNRVAVTGRNQKKDVNYKNYGLSLNIYNKSHSFTIYDKTAEIYAFEPQTVQAALNLPEVLRLEVRLEKTQKINQVFTRLNLPTSPSFRTAFDAEISRTVVSDYWNQHIAPQLSVISGNTESAIEVLQKLLARSPKTGSHSALKLTALVLCGRSPGGLSVLRAILHRRHATQSLTRINKQIKEANNILSQDENPWKQEIETQLTAYNPVSLINN